MLNRVFNVGDIVELKKAHPCGSKLWKILRIGADFRVECQGCKHSLMVPRPKFEKSVKKNVGMSQNERSS